MDKRSELIALANKLRDILDENTKDDVVVSTDTSFTLGYSILVEMYRFRQEYGINHLIEAFMVGLDDNIRINSLIACDKTFFKDNDEVLAKTAEIMSQAKIIREIEML